MSSIFPIFLFLYQYLTKGDLFFLGSSEVLFFPLYIESFCVCGTLEDGPIRISLFQILDWDICSHALYFPG